MVGFVDSLAGRLDTLATLPWTFSESSLELTHPQARELSAEVTALLDRYRRETGAPAGDPAAVRAVFQFQMLPDELAGPPSPGAGAGGPAGGASAAPGGAQ